MSAATGRPWGKEKIVEFDRRSTSSHYLVSTLWKMLRTCHKTHYATNGRAIKAGKLPFHNDSMFALSSLWGSTETERRRMCRYKCLTGWSQQYTHHFSTQIIVGQGKSLSISSCDNTASLAEYLVSSSLKKILGLAKYTTLWKIYYLV